jgi:hypothetical protein
MKYKHINAMLHNFGHSFISLMNYVDDEYIIDVLAELAFQIPEHELEINFSTGQILPAGEYPIKLYKSIAYWKEWLPKHMEHHRITPSALSEVHLRFRLVRVGREVIVTTSDDRGKNYKVFVHG